MYQKDLPKHYKEIKNLRFLSLAGFLVRLIITIEHMQAALGLYSNQVLTVTIGGENGSPHSKIKYSKLSKLKKSISGKVLFCVQATNRQLYLNTTPRVTEGCRSKSKVRTAYWQHLRIGQSQNWKRGLAWFWYCPSHG